MAKQVKLLLWTIQKATFNCRMPLFYGNYSIHILKWLFEDNLIECFSLWFWIWVYIGIYVFPKYLSNLKAEEAKNVQCVSKKKMYVLFPTQGKLILWIEHVLLSSSHGCIDISGKVCFRHVMFLYFLAILILDIFLRKHCGIFG